MNSGDEKQDAQLLNNTKVVANIIMEKDRKKRVKEKCNGNQGGLLDKKEKTKKSLLLCLTAAGAR